MQFKELSITTDRFNVKKKSWKFRVFIVYGFVVTHVQSLSFYVWKKLKVLELKWVVDFYSLFIVFLFACKHSLLLNNLKTKKARNAKISGFAIHVETIIFLLLHNLHHWMCIITKLFFKTSAGSTPLSYKDPFLPARIS